MRGMLRKYITIESPLVKVVVVFLSLRCWLLSTLCSVRVFSHLTERLPFFFR